MAVQMTLICHAAAGAAQPAVFPTDPDLDESALRTAGALASELGRFDFAWTSPALRARRTAAALGLDAAPAPALRPCDHGRWTGRSLADVQASDGDDAMAAWLSDPAAAPHGGESMRDVLARVGAWLDARGAGTGREAGREAGRETRREAAVAHPEVLRAAIMHVLGSADGFARIDVAPLTCVALTFHRVWRLRALTPAGR